MSGSRISPILLCFLQTFARYNSKVNVEVQYRMGVIGRTYSFHGSLPFGMSQITENV
jgi:hypothetical protein